MLTEAGCRSRRALLWQNVAENIDWVVITSPAHQTYFANFTPSPFVFNSQRAPALLLLGRAGASLLIADNVQQPFIDCAYVDEREMPLWYRCVESASDRDALLLENAVRCVGERCRGTLGFEAASCPAALLDRLRTGHGAAISGCVPIDLTLRELRRSKAEDEVALLLRSMHAGEAGHAAALSGIEPGMTELEAWLHVQNAACRAAGEQAIVYGDFASGPRCEAGGGGPTNRVICRGDLVLLDFSVVIGGYRGDFANTFACGAKATSAQHALADACCAAMVAGEALLRPGVSCREVDAAVRGAFEKRQLAASFTHHSGHGVGLGHPEPPFLVPQSVETLQAGDVVTLEPGLYVPGTGGMRYERNYLITASGCDVLSKHQLTIDAG